MPMTPADGRAMIDALVEATSTTDAAARRSAITSTLRTVRADTFRDAAELAERRIDLSHAELAEMFRELADS